MDGERRNSCSQDSYAAREAVHFLIERRADQAAIGYARVARVPGSLHRGDLSYWIGEDYHGQGYATEAALAAVGAAFESLVLAYLYVRGKLALIPHVLLLNVERESSSAGPPPPRCRSAFA